MVYLDTHRESLESTAAGHCQAAAETAAESCHCSHLPMNHLPRKQLSLDHHHLAKYSAHRLHTKMLLDFERGHCRLYLLDPGPAALRDAVLIVPFSL